MLRPPLKSPPSIDQRERKKNKEKTGNRTWETKVYYQRLISLFTGWVGTVPSSRALFGTVSVSSTRYFLNLVSFDKWKPNHGVFLIKVVDERLRWNLQFVSCQGLEFSLSEKGVSCSHCCSKLECSRIEDLRRLKTLERKGWRCAGDVWNGAE